MRSMMKEKRSTDAVGEKKKFYLLTLGCSKNQIDSESLEIRLTGAGLERTDYVEDADLVLLNSCGFINDAKVETIDAAFELHGRRRQDSLMVMCGCLPARYDLKESLSEIDLFVPSGEHDRLISKLKHAGWPLTESGIGISRVKPSEPFGYLKITEGCDNRCSYCAIPDIKGPFSSRPPEQIIREAEYLCARGVKELVLIGQDTADYGRDLGWSRLLPKLLNLLNDVDGCAWIRLMYAHPAHLNDEIIDALSSEKKVVKYIDLPLQHINSRVLKSMNRKIDRAGVETLIDRLRGKMPRIAIRTTFMVGFPGETDEEFRELLDFCEQIRFDHLGIFKYSLEDGTPAERLPNRVRPGEIEERYLTLLDLQNNISAELLENRLGMSEPVLLQKVNQDGRGVGRARFQAPEVDGEVIIEKCRGREGDFVEVVFTRSEAYDLYGIQN